MSQVEKETLAFDEVGNHPLLQPHSVKGILTYFVQRANSYPLAPLMPLVNENADKIIMDVEKASRGGMTPAVSMNSETPIWGKSGRGQTEFEAAEFREKAVIFEKDIYNLRKIGTDADLENAKDLLSRRYATLQIRLLNRLEWMRRQVLFDNQVRAGMADGTELVVDYVHPAHLRIELTGTDLWSDPAADPIATLQQIVEDYTRDTGFTPARIILPLGGFRHLTANANFRAISVNSFGSFQGDRNAISQLMQRFLGIGDIQEVNSQMNFTGEVLADAAANQKVAVLDEVSELAPGDVVIIKSALNRNSVRLTVASILGNTVTFVEDIGLVGGIRRGDPYAYSKPVIPMNKLLIVGQTDMPISTEGQGSSGPDANLMGIGNVVSTLSGYGDLENRKPGLFSKKREFLDGDPPRIEQVIGIRALPRLDYNEAWATVKFLA